MSKKYLAIYIGLCSTFLSKAQDTWSLERCIDYAQKNSISVKQSQTQISNAELTTRQLNANKRPGVNFSSSIGANAGRFPNPKTATYDSVVAFGSNSYSLNTNGPIYQGGQIDKSIEQNKYRIEASKADLEQAQMNISLNVASAYLRVLQSGDQLISAEKRLEQSKKQLEQIGKLINAGAKPLNDKFEFIAQTARAEQSVVAAQNNVDLEYLNLKQLLELDPEIPFKIERPKLPTINDNGVEGLTMRAIYQQAYGRQPEIRAGEMRLKSAEMQAEIEKTSYRPTASWFGGLNTNYSNVFKKAYFSVLRDNIGLNGGISLNIPIYDKGLTRIAIERARLEVANQQLQNQKTNQKLKSDIQTALANAKAARKQLEAAQKTFEAAKNAFESTEKKFSLGSANTYEVTTAKNNMDTAEQDLIISKYDAIFRQKIVDFYQGKKLTL